MKKIKLIAMYFVVALIFFQCQETDVVAPQQPVVVEELVAGTSYQTGSTYYVATTGSDANNGSSGAPWKTLRYAVSRVSSGAGHTIRLAAGTYVESGLIEVPLGVNIEGAGKDQTILKAASSFYYNPTSPAYATDKFLISLNAGGYVAGRQVIKNFTIDGDGKKLHGGIYVHYRNNVNIENVKVQYTNFTGIWLWDMKDSGMKNVSTLNCSWASSGWQSGAINVGNLERVEFDQVNVNEGVGYGIKAIGPSGFNQFKQFIIHDSRVSVNPVGTWNGGTAPNIAIELWQSQLVACQIYNTYVDNTISLVNSNGPAATGVQSIRVYNNTIDMETRSAGSGYGVELSIHDAEIDHNYFIKGQQGIANWDNAFSNWSIHHNIFYGIQGTYPGEIVRSQRSGLHNVKLYNNTIEFIGTKTANVVGLYGGSSSTIDIKNNLIINSNTSYNWYPNKLVHQEGGATIGNLQVGNNLLQNLSLGGLIGSILNNVLSDPRISKGGVRPTPYYIPTSGSPLIDGGVNVGLPFAGSKPDIGAYETGLAATPPPASPTTPANPTTSYVQVEIDASHATMAGKMTMGTDASAGYYFGIPSGNGNSFYIPPTSSATFNFQAPKTDTYTLWIKVKAANSDSRGFHIYDGRGRYTTWKAGSRSTWTWVKVTDNGSSTVVNFNLQEGANTVQFGWLNDNVQVDKIVYTNNPNYTPTN
jgi:hypothetical protein